MSETLTSRAGLREKKRLPPMRRVVLLFTLAFLAALALDVYPGLRGGAGWRWPYALPPTPNGVLLLAGLLAVYLAGAVVLLRRQAGGAAVLWAGLGAAAIGVAVVGVRGEAGFLLFTRTVSPVQTGASALAVRVMAEDGVHTTLTRWPQVMREAEAANLIHFTTSPPGQPLVHAALGAAFDALPGLSRPLSLALRPYQCTDLQVMRYTRGEIVSAGVGMLMPLWAALAVLPVYWAARMLSPAHGAESAGALVLWWPLIPTLSLFAPTWNTLYPLLGALSFALLLAGLRRRGSGFALGSAGAGVVFSAATFLNFAVLPLLLLFGLFTLGTCLFVPQAAAPTVRGRVLRAVWAGAAFGLGLLSVWAVTFAATGVTPLDILRVTFDAHTALVQRDYLPWLVLHPYDTLLFVGWPLALLFLAACVRGVQRARQRADALTVQGVLLAAFALTVAAVNLAGIVQGENGRILSVYAPFFLLCAAGVMQAQPREWALPLLGAQGLAVLVMAAVLPVVPLDLNPQPNAPRQDVPSFDFLPLAPAPAVFSSATAAGTVALESYRFIADVAAQAISLETRWRGAAPTERPYAFEVVATAENAIDGAIITDPYRWYPQSGNYLTTCWQAGDAVRDVTVIPLPTISAPVVWTLRLRLIDERTGDAPRITLPDGTQQDYVALGPVRYP